MDKTKSQSIASTHAGSEAQQQGEHILFIGAKRALIGGLLAGGIVLLGQFMVGRVYSGTEARGLLQAMIPSARSVGTGVVGASATILALMLTMLSLSRHAVSRLEALFFKRVERIGLLSTIALSSGILLLLLLSIPVQESKNVPNSWFTTVYYVLTVLTAAVAGLLVAIVLMLYNAMQSLIRVLQQARSDDKPRSSQDSSTTSPNQADQ